MSDMIPLAQAPREYREKTGKSVTYTKLYKLVLDGVIPAENRRGRWYLTKAQIPLITQALAV